MMKGSGAEAEGLSEALSDGGGQWESNPPRNGCRPHPILSPATPPDVIASVSATY